MVRRDGRVDIRRSADRFTTTTEWLVSRHSFSFGQHYDPRNVGHALLVVNNEDLVRPGAGFDRHEHRDVEIVTWMLGGSLVHEDSAGSSGVIHPGHAQRMSAGAGVLHVERNADADGTPAHFVQMWVRPDRPGGPTSYEQRDVTVELAGGGLVPVVSGMPEHAGAAAVRLGSRHAALHVARLDRGGRVTLPDAPYLHLFVAHGPVLLEDEGRLGDGDAARVTGGGGHVVVADADGTELLVWEMHAARPAG